jgi:membrane-bound lytic murein transglycosylase D
MKLKKSIIILVAVFLVTPMAHGGSNDLRNFPSLVSSIRDLNAVEFCGERVPLEIQEVRERLEKDLLLSIWDRPQVILWLKRSGKYFPHMEKMLRESGVPEDLKYVAVAESALRPHARSPKRAIGFWQFLSYTGRKYGLAINRHVDERRNIFASTQAAIRFFKDLHKKFGSWTLAVAAYNMGEDGLMAEIQEQEINDYYRLHLNSETQRFIFRIQSIKMIFESPEKYGFKLEESDYYPLLVFDRIEVKCFKKTPILIIAKAASTHFKEIKDLNPELRGYYLTKGQHDLLIPRGTSIGFQDRYQALLKTYPKSRKQRVYVVRSGDTLSAIADKFGVSVNSLAMWNHINPRHPIYPGDRIVIYAKP